MIKGYPMTVTDRALMAHLMRRAGFGATPEEIDVCIADGYEATVEALLSPEAPRSLPEDIIRRYHVDQSELRLVDSAVANWLYRMVSTDAPLVEKMALFWHGLFATGERKVNQVKTLMSQIDMFRHCGLGDFRTLLVAVSKDPAMIFWLDNNDNHTDSINENFGRELLELFSMGIGNYTEEDIKECARAFTGGTIQNAEFMALRSHKASIWPYGRVAWQYEYRRDDHDGGEKTVLGQTGRFEGDDVVDIIVRNPATAAFVCSRLFQFFVADEIDDEGRALVDAMQRTYFDSGREIRAVLSTMFLSELFRSEQVRFAHVKSPAEMVAGTLRAADALAWPTLEAWEAALVTGYMGQELLNPPSVEGWHEGREWIDSGALVERVNFAARYLGDLARPGVRALVERLASERKGRMTPRELVDGCLDLLGLSSVARDTREALADHAAAEGDLDLADVASDERPQQRVAEMLRLIASTREFQLA